MKAFITIHFALLLSFVVVTTGHGQELLVKPYLQPGNVSGLSKEKKVLIWQTNHVPAEFEVHYVLGTAFDSGEKVQSAKVKGVSLEISGDQSIIYRAELNKLEFDSKYRYEVKLKGETIGSGIFRTRTKGDSVKFVMMGDCCSGTRAQAAIANQVYLIQPDFGMIIGDVVYETGRMSEYHTNYFPYYLADEPDPTLGAPLLNTIPFYNVIGNHDVLSTDLDKSPDGLAYFYYHDLPLNAPLAQYPLKAGGSHEAVREFTKANRPRYPSMTNYSFVYGNVHVVAIDSNPYTSPLDAALVPWLREELKNSSSTWKIVTFHHPAFNSSIAHKDDQVMRLLVPVLEELGVDLVFSGHVHNYQRTVPLRFEPEKDEEKAIYVVSPEGRVDGAFMLDTAFDGVTRTKPNGIIYLVTGAGGASLYDYKQTDTPEQWLNGPNSKTPFTVKMISNTHSFTSIETHGNQLKVWQLDTEGNIIDKLILTK